MSPAADIPEFRRTVRSFVRRAGRLTAGQKSALAELWPKYGVDFAARILDLDALFGRHAPCIMEIGFGNGELIAEMAANAPDMDFIGVEVHEPGVGHCLMLVDARNLTNVRIIRHDAVEVLRDQIPDAALAGVNLFFPDPWPKKRHHKRRIVQPDFVALLSRKIRIGGVVQIATDWAGYAEHIEAIVAANPSFEATDGPLTGRRVTKFEQRGKNLGHGIYDLVYRRVRCTQDPRNAL